MRYACLFERGRMIGGASSNPWSSNIMITVYRTSLPSETFMEHAKLKPRRDTSNKRIRTNTNSTTWMASLLFRLALGHYWHYLMSVEW
jgi:hypothetical protein